MTISDVVRAALRMGGKKQVELAEEWGYSSAQGLGLKFNRGSWSANDLANVAEFTGGRLAIIYPDGQQILVYPESLPRTKGKNKPAEDAE